MPSSPTPFLSVIVPVGTTNPRVIHCLRALSRQVLPSGCFEIIAVFDGVAPPSDIVNAVAPSSVISLITSQTRCGRAAAINRGLRHAQGTVAVSIDSDMIASPTLLSSYFTAHRSTSNRNTANRYFRWRLCGPGAGPARGGRRRKTTRKQPTSAADRGQSCRAVALRRARRAGSEQYPAANHPDAAFRPNRRRG